MNKEFERKISALYDELQIKDSNDLLDRRNEIQNVLPEVIEIEKQISKFCLELSLKAIRERSSSSINLNSLKETITDLRIKKSELLVSKGYSLDYLEMKYFCPKCKDTGYVGTSRCSCYKENLVKLYYDSSDLKELISDANFDKFTIECFSKEKHPDDPESPKTAMKKTLTKSLSFIKNFGTNYDNLLFYGNSGTGKTFLSSCIARELLTKGYLVIYRTSEQLISDLRKVRFDNNTLLYDTLISCDLLIIDDLGTEQMSDFSKTELFNIVNTKLLKKQPMLINTNLSLDEMMKTYSERLTSRLIGNFSLYKFFGEDLRIVKNLSRKPKSII